MMTFNVLVGDMSCPNKCSICISKMTPTMGLDKYHSINSYRFKKALRVAENRRCKNLLLTGKGEPMLFQDDILKFVTIIGEESKFERIELQTSGFPWDKDFLEELDLDLISISIYDYINAHNRGFYDNHRMPKIEDMIADVRDIGVEVRLSCNLIKGYVDSPLAVGQLIAFAKEHDVMQLTLREIGVPSNMLDTPEARAAYDAVRDKKFDIRQIHRYLKDVGHLCYTMTHGAEVYEVDGQNVSLTTCLETEPNRYLIYFPQGWLTTSWEYVQGCRIL